MPKKATQEEVIAAFHQTHGNRYDYSMMEYVSSSSKVRVICSQHGMFEVTPQHHKKGIGCRPCYFDRQKISKEEFLRRSKEAFGELYNYSYFSEMPSHGEKVKILCVEHKKLFLQDPRIHMRGHTGCPICQSVKLSGPTENRGVIRNKEEITEEVVKKFKSVHGDIYNYQKFSYVNSSTKGEIICEIHGSFFQITHNHLKGHNCPQCSIIKKKGNTFKKLCHEKGVDYYRALKRRQAGLSLDKIFDQDFIRRSREVNPIKVFGKSYPNLKEAVRSLKPPASRKTINRWMDEGMSPEEAFERIPNPGYSEGIIYVVTNITTGKKYVGLTVQTLERRWKYHTEQAQSNRVKSELSLHAAIRRYGALDFNIQYLDRGTTKKNLESKERHWIKKMGTLTPNGYNICKGGVSGGSNKKSLTVDDIHFESIGQATEYIAMSKKISLAAAQKRISTGRIDIKKPAKKGESLVKTKAYKAWSRIIHGALNPRSKDYISGVEVHEAWRDFSIFLHDVGNPPTNHVAFTRLDKTRGFFPDNCAWLTKSDSSKLNASYMKEQGMLTGRKKKSMP
jgi:group I intron endonuclease